MADNCKACGHVISHTQYNCYDGYCMDCYQNPIQGYYKRLGSWSKAEEQYAKDENEVKQ